MRNFVLALLPAAALALLMWLMAAHRVLPGDWPAWPFDPARMNLQQILLAFGLMPRGAIALVAGAALGLSGALLQAVLRNPVADPTTLGISGGAQLGLVIATILAPGLLEHGRWPVALTGAGLAAGLVMAIGARRAFAPVTMVIAGMMVAMTASAIATAITLARGEYLLSLVIWNGGSLVQNDRLTAFFSDMRLFHAVTLSRRGDVWHGAGHHLCIADDYDTTYLIAPDRLRITHDVAGPKKAYRLETEYHPA